MDYTLKVIFEKIPCEKYYKEKRSASLDGGSFRLRPKALKKNTRISDTKFLTKMIGVINSIND